MYNTLISTKDLVINLDDPNWRIVDCRFSLDDPDRGRADFRAAHIPGASYAHLNDDLSAPVVPGKTARHPLPDVGQLANLFSKWGIDAQVQVVAYDDATGGIAARLWWMLRWLGHEKVAVLDGGWNMWKENGYKTTDQPATPKSRKFTPYPREEFVVSSDFVEKRRDDEEYVLIDSRARERYIGEHEPIDPVAGHIPGAINAPYAENLKADDCFIEKKALRRRFRDLLDGKKARRAIFYCGSGVTACHNLLALYHAGLGEARLFAGSWSEWIIDPARPVARAMVSSQ